MKRFYTLTWISREKRNLHDNAVKLYLVLQEREAIISEKLAPRATDREINSLESHVAKWTSKIHSVIIWKGKQRRQRDRRTSLKQGDGVWSRLTDYWRIWTSSTEIVCVAKFVAHSRCISASVTSIRWRRAKLDLYEFFLERNMPEK